MRISTFVENQQGHQLCGKNGKVDIEDNRAVINPVIIFSSPLALSLVPWNLSHFPDLDIPVADHKGL